MAIITILTPCFNERDNIHELYQQVQKVTSEISDHQFLHLFIDNNSNDGSQDLLRDLARKDPSLQVIFNNRNFGHIRSPIYGLLEAQGDAVILMASDLQDPPYLIREFVFEWKRKGVQMVMAVRTESEESRFLFLIRKFFYFLISKVSDVQLMKNFTGTGLYSREIIEALRRVEDPYPYLRGLIAELGFSSAPVFFKQPRRKRGITKNNFFTLYDMAILGIVTHSRWPLRLATLLGFTLSFLSLVSALCYLLAKLFFWYSFQTGMAPLLIGFFFIASVQLFFIGIIGEYVGTILTQVQNRPLVVERERLNFKRDQ